MPKEQLAIGQVGHIGRESFTGLSKWMEHERVPRIIILEHKHAMCLYNDQNEESAETARETGNTVISADIYKPLPEWSAPHLGLLLLEDMLNDPAYLPPKNCMQLAKNLHTMMSDGGLVLATDTHDPPMRFEFYTSVINAMAENSFATILDEVTESHFISSSIRIDEYFPQREEALLAQLGELDLLDEPLVQGVAAHAQQPTEYWLLFKKITGK